MNINGIELPKNVYEWLDLLRVRPLAFLGTMEEPLIKLQAMLNGYYMALDYHGIYEDVPRLDANFLTWLSTKRDWGFAGGFAKPFKEHAPLSMSELEIFFQFVDEYRKLKPTILLTVDLKSKHNPTGRRVLICGKHLIDKPDRISIVRYKPTRLHLLRFHYGEVVKDDLFLWKGMISYSTSIADAKNWVYDEFGVLDEEWQNPTVKPK